MEFIETTKNEASKAAWLEKRKHYITGTDAGKLIGVSPYGGKFAVWLDKTGRAAPVVETDYAESLNEDLDDPDGAHYTVGMIKENG